MTKFCKDCKHFRRPLFEDLGCWHPDNLDVVYAKPDAIPSAMRNYGRCGPAGKYWEDRHD